MSVVVYIAYSLPRLISPAIQCSFCAYMWELYTTEFGWSAAEYGTISSWLYSGTQIIAFITLGGIFTLIETKGSDKINATKGILAGGTFLHWLTYFLLIYLPIRWHGVKIFGNSLPTRPKQTLKRVTKILPVLETLREPTCSACCNTTCCNNFAMRLRHFGRWFGTRTFLLYMITIIHSIGMAMHELSNKVLEGYVGMASINYNLSFFLGSNIIVYLIFSFVKSYLHSKAAFAETFTFLYYLFLVLGIPILPAFYFGTTADSGSSKGIDKPGFSAICLVFKFLSATTFHGTIVFLIFSGGPLISYVGAAILGGHKVLISFGVLVLFGALNCTSWIHMAITTFNDTARGKAFGDPITQMSIAGGCIVLQSFTFTLFYQHDWWWNKGNWFNYLMFIFTGAVNAIFVTYANVMQSGVTGDARCKNWKWLYHGAFYSCTNVVVTFSMLRMFGSFAYNETRQCGCKCFPISYKYNFPSVYKKLTGLFILANIIAFGVYFLVHRVDRLLALAAKLTGSAIDLKAAADAFNAQGGDTLPNFKAASKALQAAGDALVAFATELKENSSVANNGTVTNALNSTKTDFQNAAKDSNDNSFKNASEDLNSAFTGAGLTITQFNTAKSSFASADFNTGSATAFQAYATNFQSASSNFNSAATDQKVTETSFNTAKTSGTSFGNAKTKFSGAATSFQTAATTLYGQIKNSLWLSP